MMIFIYIIYKITHLYSFYLKNLCSLLFHVFISTNLFWLVEVNDLSEPHVKLTRLYERGCTRCILFKEDITVLLCLWNQLTDHISKGVKFSARTGSKLIQDQLGQLEILEVIRSSGIVCNTFVITPP